MSLIYEEGGKLFKVTILSVKTDLKRGKMTRLFPYQAVSHQRLTYLHSAYITASCTGSG